MCPLFYLKVSTTGIICYHFSIDADTFPTGHKYVTGGVYKTGVFESKNA